MSMETANIPGRALVDSAGRQKLHMPALCIREESNLKAGQATTPDLLVGQLC
jgi:hypothetical protein